MVDQIIDIQNIRSTGPNGEVIFDVVYDLDPRVAESSGLDLQFHFNSDDLEINQDNRGDVFEILAPNFQGFGGPNEDQDNADGVDETDQFIRLPWLDAQNLEFPGGDLPFTVFTVTADTTADFDGTTIGFSDGGSLLQTNPDADPTGEGQALEFGDPKTFEIPEETNQPPEFAQDEFNFNIDENVNGNVAQGDVVGEVEVTDEGNDLNELTFAIAAGNDDVDGDGEGAFTINEQGEILVNDPDDLDFEQQQEFLLDLTVADPSGAEDTATANIAINEIVENQPPQNAPPEVGVDNFFTVNQFAAAGDVVGTLDIADPDTPIEELEIELDEASQVRLISSLTGGRTEEPDVDGDGNDPFDIEVNNGEAQIVVNDRGDLTPYLEVETINVGGFSFNLAARPVSSFDLLFNVNDGDNEVQGEASIDVEFEPQATGFGTSHITTFDRNNFDFQVVGEFTLVEDGNLTIQARTAPTVQEDGTESENLSNYTAVGVGVGDDTVAIYANEDNPVYIDGEANELGDLENAQTENGELAVTNLGSGFFSITLNDTDDQVLVQSLEGANGNARVEPRISLSNARNGNVAGVLGNKDGNPDNDFVLPDGTPLEDPSFDQINGEFAESWRVGLQESILLRSNEDVSEINDRDFNPVELTVPNSLEETLANLEEELGLSEDELDAIVDRVQDADIDDGFLFNSAVVDLAVTGDTSFLNSARSAGAANNAPQVDNTVFRIEEDLADGEVVGTVSIRDSDDGLENLEISISQGNTDVNGNGEDVFAIDEQGQITVNDSGDLAEQDGSTFSLTVEAVDPLGARGTGSVTVIEEGSDEAQPPSVAATLFVDQIREGSDEGTFVGQASAVDPDAETEEFEFALDGNLDLDGDGEDVFAIDSEGRITVNDTDDLDFEQQESFTFNVTATEVGTPDELTGQTEVTVGVVEAQEEELSSDFNDDGLVNLDDLGIFASAFGSQQGEDNFNPIADLTGDGFINLDDLGVFASEFG